MPENLFYDVLIIGGGAAGFFTAVNLAEKRPDLKICILERGKKVLQKVLISGGGRCNVTHAVWEPRELTAFYPRGHRELLGPFHRFMTGDTMQWFEDRGVPLKIEEDGRIFPLSDSSSDVVECLVTLSRKRNITLHTSTSVNDFSYIQDGWEIQTKTKTYNTKQLVIATGSSLQMWKMLAKAGHQIAPAVPSLFTFNLANKEICKLAGTTAEVTVSLNGTKLISLGPLLVTHWGFSGPAVLKMSAWGAHILRGRNYNFTLKINWLNHISSEQCLNKLKSLRDSSKKQISNTPQFNLSRRLWEFLVERSGCTGVGFADASNAILSKLAAVLTADQHQVTGKSTFKDEFVTAGGVALEEIDFRNYKSKVLPSCYLAGEVMDVDAVTGGFNFQNCWTGGYIIAESIAAEI